MEVFLRVHPKVTHAVVRLMKEVGNAGQADIIFGTWQVAADHLLKTQGRKMEALKKILSDEDTVDLTPMIGVTFLLLIYFMVTTMLKQPEAELSIQLPGKPQE